MGSVADSASDLIFGDGGAGAAQGAAMAKQAEARRQYAEIKKITDQATSSGMAQFEKDIANQERNLSRQEQLISQLDPTIIEASQQALRLLRGEEAASLGPIKNQRAQQRQKLVNSLREQLGPGAETSTAGIQALTRFDSETGNLMSGAQQSALSGLGSLSQQFTSQRPDMLREIMGRSEFGQGGSNLLFKQAGMLSGQGQSLIDTAGAEFTGDAIRGQQRAAFGGAILSGAIQGASAAATGGASSAGGGGSSMGKNFMMGIGAKRADQYGG